MRWRRSEEPGTPAGAARERLENLLVSGGFRPQGGGKRPRQYNYKPNPYPQEDTVIASEECSGEGEGAGSQPRPGQRHDGKGHGAGDPADELVRWRRS